MDNPCNSKLTDSYVSQSICAPWIVLLLLLARPAAVQAQFNYTTNNGTITITGYTGSGGAVTIPDTINGLPVTSIGGYYDSYFEHRGAFEDDQSVTSVAIPDSVTSIGETAFYYCTSLTSATIGNSVTSIGDGAFSHTGLTNVAIGNSVTTIGYGAFGFCELISVIIPNSVRCIGIEAFRRCPLTSVTIGKSVSSIENDAFLDCFRLMAFTVDGANAFYSSVDGVLLDKSQTTLIQCPSAKAGNVTIPGSVTNIPIYAFYNCTHLTDVTIPDSVVNIGFGAFEGCVSLTNLIIGNSVASIGGYAFYWCTSLTDITIPTSVASIWSQAFGSCFSLTNVTISSSVTNIGDSAFAGCTSLKGVYFQGNAPLLGLGVFSSDGDATVYYLPGTAGWGATFGGLPTALWSQVPTIQKQPQTQTAEAASAVRFSARASSPLPLFYFWYLDATNLLGYGTNWQLELNHVQFSQSGAYTVVISNVLGAITSVPVLLNVIAPVERRPVPGVKVTGEAGSLLTVDYANGTSDTTCWDALGSVNLISTPQYYFDLTLPLPPQRYYRAWQTGAPGVRLSLDLHFVPAITLTGNIGGSVRVDSINRFGPTDAWFILDTVTLTNTSQLYFDTSAWRQPERLYRLVPLP